MGHGPGEPNGDASTGWSSPGGASAPPAAGAAGPAAPAAPSATTSSGGARRAATAAAAVFALLLASVVVAVNMAAADGADSPEAAVEHLMAALEDRDAIGILESLPPGERAVLRDPFLDVVDELQRLELLADFDAGDVPGFELDVEGLELSSTPLGDGVATVHFDAGTITGRVLPDELPAGSTLRSVLGDDLEDSLDELDGEGSADLAGSGIDIVAVEEGGGWHASLFYTAAEAARGDHRVPDFGHELRPVGADSPEDAVEETVAALVDLDLLTVVGMLPPDEMRVLHDYAPVFLEDAGDPREAIGTQSLTITLDAIETRSEGGGDVRRVVVDHLEVTISDEAYQTRVVHDEGCTKLTHTYPEHLGAYADESMEGEDPVTETIEVCPGQPVRVDGDVVDDGVDGDVLDVTSLLSDDVEQFAFTVVQRDGRWYLSPTRSLLDPMLDVLGAIDAGELRTFLEEAGDWMGTGGVERFEATGNAIGGSDPYATCTAVLDDLDDDATVTEWREAEEAVDECLAASDDPTTSDTVPIPSSGPWHGDPRMVGDAVATPIGDEVRGHDPVTLEVRWTVDCPDAGWATALPGTADDLELARCGGEHTAIDGSGTVRWQRALQPSIDRQRLGPSVLAIQGADFGIIVLDAGTGAEIAHLPWWRSANVASDRTHLYIADDQAVRALALADLSTDDLRSAPMTTLAEPASGLWAVDGAIVVRSNEHVVSEVRLSGPTTSWRSAPAPDELAWSDVVGTTEATVALAGEAGILSVYSRTDGSVLWQREAPAGTVGVGGSYVTVGGWDGVLTVHDAVSGDEVARRTDAVASRAAVTGSAAYYVAFGEQGTELRRIPLG